MGRHRWGIVCPVGRRVRRTRPHEICGYVNRDTVVVHGPRQKRPQVGLSGLGGKIRNESAGDKVCRVPHECGSIVMSGRRNFRGRSSRDDGNFRPHAPDTRVMLPSAVLVRMTPAHRASSRDTYPGTPLPADCPMSITASERPLMVPLLGTQSRS